jgi:hypothetical protein
MGESARALFDREFRAEVVYPAMEAHLIAVRNEYRAGRVAIQQPEGAQRITA